MSNLIIVYPFREMERLLLVSSVCVCAHESWNPPTFLNCAFEELQIIQCGDLHNSMSGQTKSACFQLVKSEKKWNR